MRKRAVWAGGIAVVAIVAALAAAKVAGVGFGAKPPAKTEATLEFAAREVVQPLVATMPLRLEFSGALVAPQTAVVRAKAAGTLLSLAVAEGSRVKAGQPLGQMDLADLNSRIAERQASVESVRAQALQAERVHAANQRLADQQFISPNALDSSRAALDAAKASVDAAQAQLATMRVGLRDAALIAPIAGLVAKRHAVPGEKLAVEQALLTIVDLSTLELAGSVGTHEVSRLAPGLAVEVRVEGVDEPVAGTLARIAPAAEPGSRSIGVTVVLPNAKERLRAGQYAIARVTLPDDNPRLTLPISAVVASNGQTQVWVLADGVLKRREVALGRRDEQNGRVEILSGITAGTQVLGARFDSLREGAKAVLVAKSAQVASAAASSPGGIVR